MRRPLEPTRDGDAARAILFDQWPVHYTAIGAMLKLRINRMGYVPRSRALSNTRRATCDFPQRRYERITWARTAR